MLKRFIFGSLLALSSFSAVAEDIRVNDDMKGYPSMGLFKIEGSLTNTSDHNFSRATITFNVYDSGGNQLGNAMASTTNLASGETWRYEALAPHNDVSSYRMSEVNAYQ